ncbi:MULTISPECIES: hypothetical protein [Shewanella]|nr:MULTISPECIES: hypothetical protein [Shewanella]
MSKFIKDNLGVIITIVGLGILVLGGIYYVEAALESQVQVLD